MSVVAARVLVVGAGGLGSPAAWFLARSGVRRFTIADDDVIAEDNLHRQVLYRDDDVGAPKVDVLARRLGDLGATEIATTGRVGPECVLDLVRSHDVVVEGADNFATKFLVADACGIARVPCSQAGVVRRTGWALLADGRGDFACLRCVFEDAPDRSPPNASGAARADTCAEAGVVGPLVGVVAALQARLALRAMLGDDVAGTLHAFDTARDREPRTTRIRARSDCPLCVSRSISSIVLDRYLPAGMIGETADTVSRSSCARDASSPETSTPVPPRLVGDPEGLPA